MQMTRLCEAFSISLVLSILLAALPIEAQTAQAKATKLRIVVVEGEDAVNIIQQKTAVAPIVEVRDENNLPVAGATVTFTVAGNSAAFGGGAQAVTLTTNTAGRVVAAGLNPLSSGPLQLNVTAAFQGQTATISIAQTNFMTAAQAAQAAAAAPGGTTGTAGAGGAGGGGLSPLTITGIAGAAVAGGVVIATQAGGNDAPTVGAATATPSTAIVGTDTAIRFTAQATDPDNDALTYQWEFGDGSTSADATPTHIYQTAGTFTARVTVRDDKASATAETVVTIKSLTGTWQSTSIVSPAFGNFSFNFRITQSGTSLSITSAPFNNGTVSFPECQFGGSVRAAAPRVVILGQPCTAIFNGAPTVVSGNTFELEPGVDGNTLTGTLTPTPRAITFTRQ